MGGGSGGGSIPGPSAQEQQQQALQNQLLQMQINDANERKAAEAARNTPEALNATAQASRTAQTATFQKTRAAEQQAAIDRVTGQLKDAGMQSLIPQYVSQITNDYGAMGYHSGNPATTNTTQVPGRVAIDQFDAQRYLDSNPDVASGIASGSAVGDAQRHYDQFGKAEGRTYSGMVNQANTVGGTADSWDDISKLSGKDYLGSIINDKRSGTKQRQYESANTQGLSRLASLGLDDGTRTNLGKQYSDRMQSLFDTSGLSANDYSNTFDSNAVLDSVMNTELSNRRQGYTTAARSAFSSFDPNKEFSDTADDNYISDIVGTQYNDARSAVDRAKARGALTDTGYSAGLSELGRSKSAADSTSQTLGGAVLDRYRKDLGGIKTTALDKASGYNFGDTFDPNSFLSQYTSKKDALGGQLGGDINSALQGQNFFDVGSVLTKAGYAQGAQNTAALSDGFSTPAGAALAQQRELNKNAQRGIGGAGTF